MSPVSRAGLLLGLFAFAGALLVSFTFEQTADQIAENERMALLASLNAMVPASSYDNDLFHDTALAQSAFLLGSPEPVTAYRARRGGEPVAVVLPVIAPDGYSGKITLLVAIAQDGSLLGVRTISHRETPGLGDAIDVERSGWIHQFIDLSLEWPEADKWKVKRDGGELDQITGATISSRAVVKAVFRALQYFRTNREDLFAEEDADEDTGDQETS